MSSLCHFCMNNSMQNGRCTVCGATSSNQFYSAPLLLQPGTKLDNGNISIVGTPWNCRDSSYATYFARDRMTNSAIILKEFLPGYLTDCRKGTTVLPESTMRKLFEDDKRALLNKCRTLAAARLCHRSIVLPEFILEENNTIYLCIKSNLDESITSFRKDEEFDLLFNPAQFLYGILAPVMDALIYLHNTKHMLHRDICPENIFFCRDGMFAEKYTVLLAPDFNLSYNVLRAGYSPPEQNMKGDQHPCIDVYSLGATAYYLLIGKAPPSAAERLCSRDDWRINNPLTLPDTRDPRIPPALSGLILEALALNPRHRIQSVQDFKFRLAKLADQYRSL